MAHTLLHMNGFDAGNSASEDYSGAEYSTNFGYASGWFSVNPPYNGYGRYLLAAVDNGYISPDITGAPFTTLCISGQFCFSNYGLGRGSAETTFIQFWDGVANQVQVEIRAAFNTATNKIDLRAYRGTSLLATASSACAGGRNEWRWISVLVNVNSSTGVVKIKVGHDNSVVMNFSGNTQNTANTRIDRIRFGRITSTGPAADIHIDDLFITSCLPSDSPLDERRIRGAIVPTGNDTVAWTPSSGTNWQCVNEIPPNNDTDYVSSNTTGAQDTFTCSWPALAGNTIYAVKIAAMARKDDAGVQNIRNVIKVGTSSYESGNRLLSNVYSRLYNIWEQNPATALAWAPGDFTSNLKFGYKVA